MFLFPCDRSVAGRRDIPHTVNCATKSHTHCFLFPHLVAHVFSMEQTPAKPPSWKWRARRRRRAFGQPLLAVRGQDHDHNHSQELSHAQSHGHDDHSHGPALEGVLDVIREGVGRGGDGNPSVIPYSLLQTVNSTGLVGFDATAAANMGVSADAGCGVEHSHSHSHSIGCHGHAHFHLDVGSLKSRPTLIR